MTDKLKKCLMLTLVIYFSAFSFFEFPGLQSLLIDLTQIIQNDAAPNKDIFALNINTDNNEFKRPFTYKQIQKTFDQLTKLNPNYIVLMISPKEITSDNSEKNKIRELFESHKNLYLFSPYTNGPLGGFKADQMFENYPRHFEMPLTKDTLFGARDSKIRRAMISYGNSPQLSFLKQLNEMGLSKHKEADFKNYFMLWDTKQIYIKTKKPEAYGFRNLDEITSEDIELNKGKSILVGTFDEFSIHISPSIFDLQQKLSEKNFKTYFFPIVITAANTIYSYISLDYIKILQINSLALFALIYILVLFSPINEKNKIIISVLYLPSIYILILILYMTTSIYIDISKTVSSVFWLQYIGMPVYLYFYFRNNEVKKFQLINQTRLDAFLTIAEKIAHDIRSPLSSIKLLVSKLDTNNPEIKPLIDDSVNRINQIAQDILTASKVEVSGAYKTLDSVDLVMILEAIIAEKKILNTSITYNLLANSKTALVLANKIEVQRVASNIIDNSIRSLKNVDNPHIEISVVSADTTYTLEISDNGRGIDRNLLSLLGKFRIEKNSADKSSNGIGIMHSKRVIEKLGGNFEINNNENKPGANVKISLKKLFNQKTPFKK